MNSSITSTLINFICHIVLVRDAQLMSIPHIVASPDLLNSTVYDEDDETCMACNYEIATCQKNVMLCTKLGCAYSRKNASHMCVR